MIGAATRNARCLMRPRYLGALMVRLVEPLAVRRRLLRYT